MGVFLSHFSYLKSTCRNLELQVDCNIVFDPNATTSFPAVFEVGAVNKTHLLEADPDIAGTGVSWLILASGFIL
ncbi:hypothetical protein B0T21DRAFT_371782 [Apiosordaria backusii]|uniref:Uncharacterized protein n=1 Tax=Apiosordaria backusii TaxID=314023 RepID=A0AA40B2N1_9PEZI|nr:hypothetical protein B0T21DRAFT_371782 [Apiosordaria backusii]